MVHLNRPILIEQRLDRITRASHDGPVALLGNEIARVRAARRIMTDDGFNIGVLYAGNRTPYPARSGPARASVADLEQEFEL